MMTHNHVTRDIRPPGQCPACDEHHDRAMNVPVCYKRHEPMPGVHQDIPHLSSECMTQHHHHLELDPHKGWHCTICDEWLPLDYKGPEPTVNRHNVLCIGCKDCERYSQQADIPPMPLDCPLYCTQHNHEEMGG